MDSEEKSRILVVDDDPSLQRLVAEILTRANMEPVSATSAQGAAQVLRSRPLPDLVILDLMLPDVSGIEFLRQMRQKAVFSELPVLILSALADPDQIKEGLAMGADRYLIKSYLANNLLAAVQELIDKGRPG